MTNSALGVTAPGSDGKIKVTDTSVYDDNMSTIGSSYKMKISEIAGYDSYTISHGDKYFGAPPTMTNGEKLICYDDTTYSYARWIFEEYTGDDIDGVENQVFYNEISVGGTYDYNICMYSSTIRRNGPVTYSVKNTDGTATDKATINATTGELVALALGNIKIGVTYPNAPYVWWRNVLINGILEGPFYIQNAGSQKYIDV